MTIPNISYRLPLVFDALGADPKILLDPPLGFATLTHSSYTNEEKKKTFPEFNEEFLGLRFNLAAPLFYKVDGVSGILRPNCFYLMYERGKCEHTLERGRYSQLSIDFPIQYLAEIENYFPVILRKLFKNAEAKTPVALCQHVPIKEPLEDMIKGIYSVPWRGIVRDAYLNCKVFQALLYCLETINKPAEQTKSDSIELQKIKTVYQYLCEHLADHFTTEMVASIVDMDTYKLRKCFKEHFKTTMSDFLFEKRMEKALSLLKESDLPVEKIGRKTGYSAGSHFSNAFKRRYGFSPSSVRSKSDRPGV